MLRRLKAAWLAFLYPEISKKEDVLTGALKRDIFSRPAKRELARAQRGKQPLSLAFLDINKLKEINDKGWHNKKGHDAGDLYLKTFAQNIINHIRPYDIFARWGGDEFILFFPNTNILDAEKIIRRAYRRFPNFTWGISEWNKRDSLKLLIGRADNRMYRKKSGESGKKRRK